MRRCTSLCVAVLALTLVLTGCDSSGSNGGDDESTITNIAQNDDRFSILADLVGRTGLDDDLGQEDDTLTVFAPTDQAFLDALDNNGNGNIDDSEIPSDAAGILKYHVVGSVFYAADEPTSPSGSQIPDGATDATTLEGSNVTIDRSGDDVTINPNDEGASVVAPDVDAENGVVHGIDTVLLPGDQSGGDDGGSDDGNGDENESQSTITEIAQNQNNLSTLVSALQAAGLDQNLNAEDQTFTVFAPKNSAFSSIETNDLTGNSALLDKVLKYHVVAGQEITAGDIADGQTVTTLEGEDLTFTKESDGTVKVNGATVTTADVQASNGIVHLIDGVLLDQANTAERASITPNLNTLTTALGTTGQDQALNDPNATFTVFAPSDDAFTPYDINFLTNNTNLLSDVLGYHVVKGSAVTSDQLSDGDTFTTLQGDQIEVSIEGGDLFVEGAQVTTANVETNNGVVHLVDDALLTNRTPLERLRVNEATQTLRQQLIDAGLDGAFNDNTWTTFAPSNQAFQNADLSGFSDSEIQEILQYHTLDGATDSETLIQTLNNNGGQVTLTTNQGEDVTIEQQSNGSIVFNPNSQNSATLNLDRVDQRAGNGSIIHQIDGVLVPPSF